jgi:vitamin B12 transporter
MKKQKSISKGIFFFKRWSHKPFAAFNSLKVLVKICTMSVACSLMAKNSSSLAQKINSLPSDRIQSLEEVTVSADKSDLLKEQTGQFIQIIESRDIQSLPINGTDDLLRYLPGIEAKSRGSYGAQTDLSIRGSNFNQILVLIDGVRTNDPVTAHFNTYFPVSLAEIDRIEILHGPAAAQYGYDAVGGVINIITKTFVNHLGKDTTILKGSVFKGNYSLTDLYTGAFVKYRKIKYGAGVNYSASDGYNLPNGNKSDFKIFTASASASFPLGKWQTSLRTAIDSRDFDAQYFYTSSPYDSARENTSRWLNHLQISRYSVKNQLDIRFANISTSDHYDFSPHTPSTINNSGLTSFSLINNYQLFNNLYFLFGAFVDNRSIQSNNRGDHSLWHSALSGSINYTNNQGFNMTGTLREEYDDNYRYQFLPAIKANYSLDRIDLRVAAGKALRSPDFTENYYNSNTGTQLPALQRIGNPYLFPEKSNSAEAGFDLHIMKSLLLNVTGFYFKYTNLIDYIKTPASELLFNSYLIDSAYYNAATNLNRFNLFGIETQLIFRKQFSPVLKIHISVGYTFLHPSSDENITGLYISSQAKHLVNAVMSVTAWKFRLTMTFLWKERNVLYSQSLGVKLKREYYLVNTGLDVLHNNHFCISCKINNLLNTKYSDILGAALPGRWLAVGVKYDFGLKI